MESLKDVFTPFYERLKRPFVGAFWISWFFVNWKLWVALLFYNQQINGVDKIEYINSLLSEDNLLYNPLKYAAIFIILMSVADFIAFSWQQFVRQQKRIVKLRIEGTTPVEPETYLKSLNEIAALKKEYSNIDQLYVKKKKEIEEKINTLNDRDKTIADTKNLLQSIQLENTRLKTNLDLLSKSGDPQSIFSGTWDMHYYDDDESIFKKSFTFNFSDSKILRVGTQNTGDYVGNIIASNINITTYSGYLIIDFISPELQPNYIFNRLAKLTLLRYNETNLDDNNNFTFLVEYIYNDERPRTNKVKLLRNERAR